MPISAIMTNDFNSLNLGIGLMIALLVVLLLPFERLTTLLHQWLTVFKQPEKPTLVPIPVLSSQAERRAARAAARRRQQEY